MTTLTDGVGRKGKNLSHDVTLVQAMLQAIARPSGPRYHDANYDGIYGPITAAAIEAFQTDRGIADPEFGTVNMATTTWRQLLQALPPDRQGMRIMMGTSIVYLAASQALLLKGQTRLASAKFRSGFAPPGRQPDTRYVPKARDRAVPGRKFGSLPHIPSPVELAFKDRTRRQPP
jgi:peptidoglycan hydrolase-like protein with peptidoglycan-binding domain